LFDRLPRPVIPADTGWRCWEKVDLNLKTTHSLSCEREMKFKVALPTSLLILAPALTQVIFIF
jgi:hypothetical protein